MYKIGVIGERDKVLSYMAAGFSVYDARNADEAAGAIKRAKSDGCAIIYITPSLAEAAGAEIEKYASQPTPAIIPLPEGGGGYGITQLSHAVERAVGSDIIFNKKR